ncbi:hypothetical protein HDU79_003375 [Rhizoclosmatium sp. JEL0117]|nr:hypothetical protein HDU79_003375 [Rhizoclosmatium sp. JEL0117]
MQLIPLILRLDPTTSTPTLALHQLHPGQPTIPLSTTQILTESISTVATLLSSTRVHQDRLIYALAGLLFSNPTILPFGGSKSRPGYLSFNGTTTSHLLTYMVTEPFNTYWSLKGREGLDFLVVSVNAVLRMQRGNRKDELDEAVMKGMKKSGMIPWSGEYYIPKLLRHVVEVEDGVGMNDSAVEFTPVIHKG